MSRTPARLAAAALFVISALFGGCGDNQSAKTPAAVRADITEALTGAAKDDCKLARYATQRFIDQATFATPMFAEGLERFCRADVPYYMASSVRVTRIKVDGDRASARITPKGGQTPYGRHDVDLVRERVWKLDALTDVELDRQHLDRRIGWFLFFLDGEPTVKQSICTKRRLDSMDDDELAGAIVRSDVDLIVDPVLVCFFRPQFRSAGVSIAASSCVVRALRDKGRLFLRVVTEGDDAKTREFLKGEIGVCKPA